MGLIATDTDKIILYYDPNSSIGKQTHAYVSASEMDTLAIDISKTNVPGSHWAEMADKLNLGVGDLIDKKHQDFKETYGDEAIDLDQDGWLKLLDKSPHLLAHPIIFIGHKCMQVETPSEVVQYLGANDKKSSE